VEAVMRMVVAGRLAIVTVALFLIWPLMAVAQEPTPPASVVIVEWTTESEVDTAGFNIYRSESAEGPYIKINPELIPSSPDPILGGKYVYTDTNVVAGGTTTMHGPIEVVAEASSPSAFANLAALWPLAVLIGVLVLGGVILWRRHGRGGG
jgi:hypothetical protein